MQKRSRLLWAILFGLPALCIIPAVLVGSAVHQAGMIEFRVLEKHDGGACVGGRVPAVLLPIAAHMAPDHVLDEVRCEFDGEAEWILDVVHVSLEELSRLPDCVLVDVRDHEDIVRVEKRDGKIEVIVDTPDEAVTASVPIAALASLADQI